MLPIRVIKQCLVSLFIISSFITYFWLVNIYIGSPIKQTDARLSKSTNFGVNVKEHLILPSNISSYEIMRNLDGFRKDFNTRSVLKKTVRERLDVKEEMVLPLKVLSHSNNQDYNRGTKVIGAFGLHQSKQSQKVNDTRLKLKSLRDSLRGLPIPDKKKMEEMAKTYTKAKPNVTTIPFSKFKYDLDIDFKLLLKNIENNNNSIVPINVYEYEFLITPRKTCGDRRIRMIFLIKTSPQNFLRRKTIRSTWANEEVMRKYLFQRVFLIGLSRAQAINSEVVKESILYNDILQINYSDNYYNNTLKTTGGIKWASEMCANANYTMFVDDDFYINTYKMAPLLDLVEANNKTYDFMGNVLNVAPLRSTKSKWYISVKDYPFDKYPPFVSAGSWIITRKLLLDMSRAIPYIKRFIYDDVYIAIVAHKLKVRPIHVKHFRMGKILYKDIAFKSTLTSHFYANSEDLHKAWQCTVANENALTLPPYCFIMRKVEKVKEIPFSKFKYALDIDFNKLVQNIKIHNNTIKPINVIKHTFHTNPMKACRTSKIKILFFVKSSPTEMQKRRYIRQTWANDAAMKTFSYKRIFVVGLSQMQSINRLINREDSRHGDILQIGHTADMYNTTAITMAGLEWIKEYCSHAEFVMFVDENVFVNIFKIGAAIMYENGGLRYSLMGNLQHLKPVRSKVSKWYVSMNEYPFDSYPPVLNPGSWIISKDLLNTMNLVIPFTRYFPFDDIFIAIIAYKLKVPPIHMRHFLTRGNTYADGDFLITLASQYNNPVHMVRAWKCVTANESNLALPTYCNGNISTDEIMDIAKHIEVI